MRNLLTLIFLLMSTLKVMAQSEPVAFDSNESLPSEELLEFLADWESVDEETWEVLEHHALEDVPGNAEVKN